RADELVAQPSSFVASGPAPTALVDLVGVAVGIFDLYLLAARAGLDLVAEVGAGATQRLHARGHVIDVDDDPIPPTGLLPPAGPGRGPRGMGAAPDVPGPRRMGSGLPSETAANGPVRCFNWNPRVWV